MLNVPGKRDEAKVLQREALAMQRKLLPKQHPDSVDSLINLGGLLGGQGEGEALYHEALTMSQELWGNDNPEAVTLLRRMGRQREALAMSRKVLGNDHRYVAICLSALAKELRKEGKLAEAEPMLREALSIRQKRDPDHWETSRAESDLRLFLLEQTRYLEAESLLLSGYEGMKQREISNFFWVLRYPHGLVQLYEAKGWPNRGREWFRKAIDHLNPDEEGELGWMYAQGAGVAKNPAEAVKWYRKATERGVGFAERNLAILYYSGDGTARDYEEAMKWFRKIADKGDAIAQFYIGTMYSRGEGVAKDAAEAVKWFRKAAEQGPAAAEGVSHSRIALAQIYSRGDGIAKDAAKALKWYRSLRKTTMRPL